MNILIHNNAVPLTSQERSGLAKYRQEIDMVVNLVDRLSDFSRGPFTVFFLFSSYGTAGYVNVTIKQTLSWHTNTVNSL